MRSPLPRRLAVLTAACLLSAPIASAPAEASPVGRASDATSSTRVVYVSPHGSDRAAGTTAATAWRSLRKVSTAALPAGSKILLRRGGHWKGRLAISQSGTSSAPLVVGAYGRGAAPRITTGDCVVVTGSWVTIDGLDARNCSNSGFLLQGDHDTVRNSSASGNVSGIYVADGADFATITTNTVTDNNRMAPNTPGATDDYGAFGIALEGDSAQVSWNTISGSTAASPDFGADGSAVEVFGSSGSVIDHNRSIDNQTFTELGSAQTTGVTYAYNVVTSSLKDATFLVTRGLGASFGPVWAVTAQRNSVLLTGPGSQAFWCGGLCGPIALDLIGNILVAQARIGYGEISLAGWSFGGGDNIYWGSGAQGQTLWGGRTLDPKFSSLRTLHLQSSSPAIDKLTGIPALSLEAGPLTWSTDVDGAPTPVDGTGDGSAQPDIGAVEYQR